MTVSNEFCELFFTSSCHEKIKWLGVPIIKNPFDLWIYQEIIFEVRPDLIIECGTCAGGSALYLASLCDLINHGQVVTIDNVDRENKPVHDRIQYISGSSISDEVSGKVNSLALGKTVMVILDSDHTEYQVFSEMQRYAHLVSIGSYLIVEDTCINGNPIFKESGNGPMEAVKHFLLENDNFESDIEREKLLFTFNPKGYLKRVK